MHQKKRTTDERLNMILQEEARLEAGFLVNNATKTHTLTEETITVYYPDLIWNVDAAEAASATTEEINTYFRKRFSDNRRIASWTPAFPNNPERVALEFEAYLVDKYRLELKNRAN